MAENVDPNIPLLHEYVRFAGYRKAISVKLLTPLNNPSADVMAAPAIQYEMIYVRDQMADDFIPAEEDTDCDQLLVLRLGDGSINVVFADNADLADPDDDGPVEFTYRGDYDIAWERVPLGPRP